MRKHFWRFVLLLATLPAVGAVVPLLATRGSPVTQSAFQRIEEGMTRAEVEAILGGPPGDYCTRPPAPVVYSYVTGERWQGDDVDVWIEFVPDAAGEQVVYSKICFEAWPLKLGLLDTVFWRIDRLMAGKRF
jgi:hypothetical protein